MHNLVGAYGPDRCFVVDEHNQLRDRSDSKVLLQHHVDSNNLGENQRSLAHFRPNAPPRNEDRTVLDVAQWQGHGRIEKHCENEVALVYVFENFEL